MEEHARYDICLEDIERASGVTRVKLFEVFRKYFGVPPMAYLKRIRFDGARQALLAEPSNGNVSAVAMAWGFKHLGRFSIEYKRCTASRPDDLVESLIARHPSEISPLKSARRVYFSFGWTSPAFAVFGLICTQKNTR